MSDATRNRDVAAVVTGAGSGIGRAVARRLAGSGLAVLAVGRTAAPLHDLAEQQPGVVAYPCTLGSHEAAVEVVAAGAELGSPLVAVHAAGVGGYTDAAVWDLEPHAWRQMMAVNLDTAFYLMQAISPAIRAAGWGRFVAVGSTAGTVAVAAQPSYSASKAGLLGLVRSAAYDLGALGATCNAVVPGWVRDTAMAEQDAHREAAARDLTIEQVWAEREASYPGGRVVAADEVAAVVAFLVSEDAGGVNGEAVTVSRGSPW